MFYDRKKFFEAVRTTISVNKSLSQSQVDGFEVLLKEGEKRLVKTEWIAYILATAWHETAFTMQPVRETLAKTDQDAINRLDKAWMSGKLKQVKTPYWRTGYFGRGYVQLTFDFNYKKMGEWLGLDLLNKPSLALDPAVAAKIIYEGMLKGMFTAKKLSDYLDGVEGPDAEELKDYEAARRIINGKDKAKQIAQYALKFQKALDASEVAKVESVEAPVKIVSEVPAKPVEEAPKVVVQPPPPHIEEDKPASKSTTIWATIVTILTSIIGILASLPPVVQITLILVIAGAGFWIIRERMKSGRGIDGLF